MAESLWEPNLAPEDLFETISQTLLNAVDRDAYSGWGAVVWLIEKVSGCCTVYNITAHAILTLAWLLQDKVTKRTLKARMD